MKDDIFIIDAVGHGIDFSQTSRVVDAAADAVTGFGRYAHRQFMGHLESDEPGFRLNEKQFAEKSIRTPKSRL